jgi:hypothetical protein
MPRAKLAAVAAAGVASGRATSQLAAVAAAQRVYGRWRCVVQTLHQTMMLPAAGAACLLPAGGLHR